jgi:hypothetical protein
MSSSPLEKLPLFSVCEKSRHFDKNEFLNNLLPNFLLKPLTTEFFKRLLQLEEKIKSTYSVTMIDELISNYEVLKT